MDAHFVPPLTIGPVVVASLRPVTGRVFHGHLMVEAPEGLFDDLAEAGLDVVSFHHEAVADPAPVIAKARGTGMRVGMTLNMETPVDAIFPYLDELDDVMLMSIKPGWSGQVLIRRSIRDWNRSARRSIVVAWPRRWSSTAVSRSTTRSARSTPEPRSWSPPRRSSRRPIQPRRPASSRRSPVGRQPRWPRRSSSSMTIRTSRGSSRSTSAPPATTSPSPPMARKRSRRPGELRPDLVLLDVMMPRIDGFEVAQRLRKNPQTANTSIIMLTAKALSADKVTGLQSGADDYIIKPFDPIELLARVKGTLRRAKEMRNLSPLTGLPGNIRIQEEIERQVREARPFAVLYCDLDNFKTYNDQKGFVRGDRLDPIDGAHHPGRDRGVRSGRRASSATSAGTTSWRS